jgi:hypothetical protein
MLNKKIQKQNEIKQSIDKQIQMKQSVKKIQKSVSDVQIFGLNDTSPKTTIKLPDINEQKDLIQQRKQEKLNFKLKAKNFDCINLQRSVQE